MSHLKFTSLTPELYDYLLKVSSHESEALKKIREENDSHPQIRMQIAPDQAQFLQFLIRITQTVRVLEIGTFLGYSAAAMAEVLPAHGQLISCDRDERIKSIAENHWKDAGLNSKIQLKIAPALDTLQELVDTHQKFDFIFIDADKGNYPNYYHMAKQLITPKGIIAIDNVFFQAEVIQDHPSKSAQAIDAFNQMLYLDDEVYISMIPIADGLTLVQKK